VKHFVKEIDFQKVYSADFSERDEDGKGEV
jgi:hypothetical protein